MSIEKFRQLPIKNITLGGEIADQVTLDKLRDLFPTASIRHVYATTETGPVFSVSDGLEGFPANLLNRELSSGKRLSINEGELVVSFSPGVESQAQKVVKTGDLVVRKDDRIRFIGRIGDVVNVGGVKVSLSDVESHCNALPGVVDSLVKAISNPFVGYVIKAEIQWESKPLTDREVRSLLSKDLQKAAVPAVIVSVQTLDLSENFKKVRKE